MKQKLKKQFPVSVYMLMLILVLSSVGITAQAQNSVSGTVSDASGSPLLGVSILQKGTSNGVVSDFDGKFTITMKPGSSTLVFTYIGYASKEVVVSGKTKVNVIMEEDVAKFEEVVVIGYAAVDRKKVLGALSSIKSEEMAESTPTSAFDAVQGRLSGVQVRTNNGPGAGFDIQIRGVSTFGAGSSPLYVVDGQQLENIDNLDPSDIESLEVLKDGATAAIYGSKAANGVVLITTKSGQKGSLVVDITHNTGFNELVGDLPVANANERLKYVRARSNNFDPQRLTGEERDSLSLLSRNNENLQKLVMRQSIRHQTNVAISGGSDKGKFYWNTGVLDEKGIVIGSQYKRLNSLLRLDTEVGSKLKLGTKINLSFEEQQGVNESFVFGQLISAIATFPIFEPNGTYTPTIAGRRNPVANAALRDSKDRSWVTQVFSYAEWEFIPKLKFKSTLGFNVKQRKLGDFEPVIVQGNLAQPPVNRYRDLLSYDIQQENFMNYRNAWGEHHLSAFAGMQIQKYYTEDFDIKAFLISDDIPTFNNADPLNIGINNSATNNERHNLFSLFGGFNYDYKNKYLITTSLRRDGSSRFGDNNEYGFFPSASLGWRVSNENFLKDSKAISNLMLRASFGVIGNERISNYDFSSALVPGSSYTGSGVGQSRIGNPDLSWESTASTNFGVELGLFNNRIDLGVDLWQKKTKDLLASVPLPEESGFGSILQNVGSVENKGIDISLGADLIKTKKFRWNSNFNLSFFENKVTQLAGGVPFFVGDYYVEEGQPIGNIYGFTNKGIFQYTQSNAFTDSGVQLTPNFDEENKFVNYTLNGVEYTGNINQLKANGQTLQGGDVYWEDLNGDFIIDEANDRKILGNGLPKYFGGWSNTLKYKDFTLSFLFDFTMGADIYAKWDEERNDLNSSNETPSPIFINNAWTKEGDISVWPRLNQVPQLRNAPNSFYIQNGDWIKLRYVRLNYNLPKAFTSKLNWLNTMSVNLAVNNVLTWTEYTGYNPEIGNRGSSLTPNFDRLRYPNDREVLIGLKVQLQ